MIEEPLGDLRTLPYPCGIAKTTPMVTTSPSGLSLIDLPDGDRGRGATPSRLATSLPPPIVRDKLLGTAICLVASHGPHPF